MSNRIYKYSLPIVNDQFISLPAGAQILHVGWQSGQELLQLWALVNASAEPTKRHIRIYGTGHNIEDANSLTHLGTVLMGGGILVWHVFESHVAGL